MRVKTDERRQAIMAAAAPIFREMGFERASMAAIAASVGGSKTTLYSYFSSKEELFAAVMMEAVEEQAEQMMSLLAEEPADLRASLEAFGVAYLDLVLLPEVLGFNRVGMAVGAQGDLGPKLYAAGPARGWARITEHLTYLAELGRLKLDDPGLAALQLKALLEAGMLEPGLFGAKPLLTKHQAAAAATSLFLSYYGV